MSNDTGSLLMTYHVWVIFDSGAAQLKGQYNTYREAVIFLETSKYPGGMILDSNNKTVYMKTGKGIGE